MTAHHDPSRLADLDDDALVRAARADGEPARAALEALLVRHEKRVYATCLRIVGDPETARDLAQDTLVRVIGAVGAFDGRARFTTWLTRIAMNVCISHLRKAKHRRAASLEAPVAAGPVGRDLLESAEPTAAGRVELDEDLARVARAMRALEEPQRVMLVLRDVRGLDYREIAEALHLPIGTVKSRLFRAREALRRAVEADDTDHHE
ncbi:MAG: sigma-70 family RNA polymerase sigma factor [Planctomycetota bacterium]|nr:MAG: sigma-70 family RNA polymerase sigma factor [Planctomycetota bacterium]